MVDIGKAIIYTGGYVSGTAATISATSAACAATAGAFCGAIPVAAATVLAVTELYYSKMKQLHGGGARGDDLLYAGKRMQGSDGRPCTISQENVQLLDQNYNVISRGKVTSAEGSLPVIHYGASISRSDEGSSDPIVEVHWFYDIGTATRYNVIYQVDRPGCAITG